MRPLLPVVLLVLLLPQAQNAEARPDSAERAIQEAWLEEEANRDFPAAVEIYQQVIREHPEDRPNVAQARLGIARCLMQMGKRDDATAMLKSVLDDFQDQKETAKRAAAYLEQWTGGSASPSVVKQNLLDAYLEDLGSADQHLRVRAAAGLGTLGDPAAVPALVEALDDEDPFVRKTAVSSLGKIADNSAVPPLLELLSDPALRPDVARALASIGNSSVVNQLLDVVYAEAALGTYAEPLKALWTNDATPYLFKLLEAAQPPAEVNWALLLPDLDPAGSLPAMLRWLGSSSPQLRAVAAAGLGRIADRSATEDLIKALSDPALQVKEAASRALGDMRVQEAVPYLIAALEESNPRIKDSAAYALNRIKSPSSLVPLIAAGALASDWRIGPEHARFLARGLDHSDPGTRRYCAELLAGVAARAQEAALTGALSDSDPAVRRSAARGLGRLKTQNATPNLVKLLDDPVPSVRIAAAESLGAIADSSATQALVDALDDADPSVKKAVALAISEIADPAAIPSLQDLLESDDVELRSIAITAAGRLKAAGYVPAILDELEYGVPKVRIAAARALGNIGADEAEGRLLFALSDTSPQVRAAAAEALGKLRSSDAVQPLASFLLSISDPTSTQPDEVRAAAAAALGNIGEIAAAQPLSHALRKDPSLTVRIVAGESLALLGDRSGVPVLAGILRDEAPGIRRTAAAALGRIGDDSVLRSLTYIAEKDPNEDVREAAMKAVEEIRARE